MTFKEFLNEKTLTVYHGDIRNISKLEIKNMFHKNGNFQEGVGIYFGNLNTAESYGKYVYKATIDKFKFVESRKTMKEVGLGSSKIKRMIQKLWKYNTEKFFYFLSDYVYVENPNDISTAHLSELSGYLEDEEVRNFQISLAEIFGPEKFVPVWNSITKIDGTFHKHNDNEDWFAIINPEIKIERVN